VGLIGYSRCFLKSFSRRYLEIPMDVSLQLKYI
jgi:hypothetical protein